MNIEELCYLEKELEKTAFLGQAVRSVLRKSPLQKRIGRGIESRTNNLVRSRVAEGKSVPGKRVIKRYKRMVEPNVRAEIASENPKRSLLKKILVGDNYRETAINKAVSKQLDSAVESSRSRFVKNQMMERARANIGSRMQSRIMSGKAPYSSAHVNRRIDRFLKVNTPKMQDTLRSQYKEPSSAVKNRYKEMIRDKQRKNISSGSAYLSERLKPSLRTAGESLAIGGLIGAGGIAYSGLRNKDGARY